MPVPHIFGSQTSPVPASKLDENFAAVGAVLLTDTGAISTTHEALSALEPRNPQIHFGSPWNNTTTSSVGLQNAVNGAYASGRGEVFLPGGDIHLDTGIELNNQSATGNYRKAIRIYGAGQARTRLINRVTAADSVHGRALFQHKLTQAQGDASSYARGLEIAHLEIYGDSSSHAACVGISIQGAYNPWLHDILINTMGSHGLATPSDSRFANADNYSCADVTLARATIISCGGWGVYGGAFATAWKVRDGCYIVSNVGGGLYLVGANNIIDGGAVAGCGASGDAASAGIHFARSTDGTPQNCRIHNCEIDGNWTNQVRTNGINTLISRTRFVDAVVAGAFRSPVQVLVEAIAGQSADSNLIEYCAFRFDDQAAVNVTALKFNLSVADGSRTVRYNRSDQNTYLANGVTSGVITECNFGPNPDSVWATGNYHYTAALPQGTTLSGAITRDVTLATGTQVISGLGFRPKSIALIGHLTSNGGVISNGTVDSGLVNRGRHYYPAGGQWGDNSTESLVFRTGAGDIYGGTVTSFSNDGFTISWIRTGVPTGTAVITWVATR